MNFVSARACDLSPALYDSLAGYRYRVFVERLGWDLQTTPGYEQDQFDKEDTVHVVARNAEGEIVGCGRLLPTTESYLLEGVFPELLNGLPVPRSEKIWELSRFAAMEVKSDADGMNSRRHFMAERVLLEALRFCKSRDVSHLLAVSTLAVERLMQRAGVDVHRVGPPRMIGGQPVLAFVIAVNEQSLNALAAFEAAALGLSARPVAVRATVGSPDLQALVALTQQYQQARHTALGALKGEPRESRDAESMSQLH